MRKKLILTVTFLCLAAAQVLHANVIQILPGLSLNTAGEDVTFQVLPEVGKDKCLCIWSGEAHLAFVLGTHEIFDKDWKAFVAHTEKGLVTAGAKKIQMLEGTAFKSDKEVEVRRYDLSMELDGQNSKQIYYIVKSANGYHSVIVTLLDPSAYDAVRARTDKLMATVSLAP